MYNKRNIGRKIEKDSEEIMRKMEKTYEKPAWQKKYMTSLNEIVICKSDTTISEKEFDEITQIMEKLLCEGTLNDQDYRNAVTLLIDKVFSRKRTVDIRVFDDHYEVIIVNKIIELLV